MEHRYPSGLEYDYVLGKVKSFFESQGFRVSFRNVESVAEVLVSDRSGKPLVKVELRKEGCSFLVKYVDLVSPGKMGLLGLALSLFGGGIFAIKDLNIKEKLDRLEREFWREMDSLFYGGV